MRAAGPRVRVDVAIPGGTRRRANETRSTMSTLEGLTVAFLTSNAGVEQPELTEPWQAVVDAGGTPVLVAPEAGEVQAVVGDLNPASTFPVDRVLGEVSAS